MNEDAEVRRWLPVVENLVNIALYRYPGAERADVHSDALLGLLLALRSYDPARGELKPHLIAKVQLAIIDGQRAKPEFRRNRTGDWRMSLVPIEVLGEDGDELPHPALTVEDEALAAVLRAEEVAVLWGLVAELSAMIVADLRAVFLAGETLAEVGQARGKTSAAVLLNVSKGCRLLAPRLVEVGYGRRPETIARSVTGRRLRNRRLAAR